MCQTRAILAALAAVALAGLSAPAVAQDNAGVAAAPDAAPLDVAVTADSPPGWVPSEQLVRQALDAVESFFQALDAGEYPRAYGLMTAENQKDTSAARFADEGSKFNTLAGPLRRRRMLMSTWTKDPPGAPKLGIYAAFDVAAQYTNVDRQCGSLLLYQPPGGGAFNVLRSENYYMDNRTAQQIELSQSHQALIDAWTKASVNCRAFTWDAAP
jgi:hypothetical protein